MSETPNTEIKRKRSYEYHKEQKRPENHKNHAGYRHHKNGMKESKQMDENNLTDLFHMCAMQLFHKHGSKAGHYRGQTKILRILSEENEITQKELQTILNIQPGSMSEITNKLEAKGFLVRKPDESDKRKTVLVITEEGKKEVTQYHEVLSKENPFDVLSAEEKEQLKILLKKLFDSWSKRTNPHREKKSATTSIQQEQETL